MWQTFDVFLSVSAWKMGVYCNKRKKKINPSLYLFPENWFLRNHFPNFPVFICRWKSWSTEKTFRSKENLAWFPGKCFPFILDRKYFSEVVKNLEMSYYLLIISNLVLKDCSLYILFWIFIFQFHPLKFNFYINFDPCFYNCYLIFPYHFLNWNFLSIKFDLHSFDCYLFYLK